jgi:transposase
MSSQPFPCWVGIDVAAQDLVVAVRPEGLTFTVPQTRAGIRQLVRRLHTLTPTRIVLEPTGGYERAALVACAQAGLPVALVNARAIRHFAQALGVLEKTDAVDARVIAHYADAMPTRVWTAPPRAVLVLRALVQRRQQVLAMQTAERQRVRLASAAIRAEINRHLASLRRHLARLDRLIAAQIASQPSLHTPAAWLRGVPGVGPICTATLLALAPELGNLTRREIAKLIGLAPLARDSGQHRGGRRCWGGRAAVRTILYLATVSAIRCNPVIQAFYTHLRAQGKPPKVALTACARKLLVRLNAMLRDQQPWQEEGAA